MDVRVQPFYLRSHSRPPDRYVFAYHVEIRNTGAEPARLFWRHWIIHDPVAGMQEVEGEGVVGETPTLDPGDAHVYGSFCVLNAESGHMEGFFHFERPSGERFRAKIPRFRLQARPSGFGGQAAEGRETIH